MIERLLDEFIARHRLPAEYRALAQEHFLPAAEWLVEKRRAGGPLLIGINGAQGTGKSTFADFLRLVLERQSGWRVAVLSIDDFYLLHVEREALAADVHPLLRTRGVPGTHDLPLLRSYLDSLRQLGPGQTLALPRFDKSRDDRAEPSSWPSVAGPLDLIILEGWCVGSTAQPDDQLAPAVNSLERDEDPDSSWRRYVNDRLRRYESTVFQLLDALIFLRAPSFDAVYRWRLQQEQKLADKAGAAAAGVMNAQQLRRFLQHYERLTRCNLAALPESADLVLELDEAHACVASRYREQRQNAGSR